MTFRFSVESWAPEYGASLEADGPVERAQPDVRVDIELPAADWRPLAATIGRAREVAFIDGVQRIDARVWITDEAGVTGQGICGSVAAGVVRCDGAARIEEPKVDHAIIGVGVSEAIDVRVATFRPAPTVTSGTDVLLRELEGRRRTLEMAVSVGAASADLLVLDGSLFGRDQVPNAIGYLKSHEVAYLSDHPAAVVAALGPGERTPVFLTTTNWSRYSWYLRLPCAREHAWSGIVRCEAGSSLGRDEVIRLADLAAATLPEFASVPYKDRRAPQNLYPIAGLEDELRRRLGDARLIYNALRAASAAGAAPLVATPRAHDS